MKKVPPLGEVDENTLYVNKSAGIAGSPVPAAFFNAVNAEIVNTIVASGQTPSDIDFLQLMKAISVFANSINIQFFTSSGVWARPSLAKKALVFLTGGGGGGASGASSTSGMAGSTAIAVVDVSASTTFAVTIGAGGGGGLNGSGGNGGVSSFGAVNILAAAGGQGGAFSADSVQQPQGLSGASVSGVGSVFGITGGAGYNTGQIGNSFWGGCGPVYGSGGLRKNGGVLADPGQSGVCLVLTFGV